ncbi:hypothetical protein LEP1GSC151_5809 [Leptospira interrogans serovar Grippotyphosa str. LT2186]|uniref:Uncharacterized protein n=1 Tax=Leptospira interrogans serovar Grippotyphosa str. LT2186 TaxID=1001599 RepID=M3I9G8_LEPIR|nr:hypothetical protein LEP1GSC151_5809 [Leptospira interrogans serovar Grippotyphosa str. LT2186]
MSLKIPTIIQKYLVVTHVRELEFLVYREKYIYFLFRFNKEKWSF